MESIEYGIIGGSGLYEMPGFEKSESVTLKTPFGDPSDAYVLGKLGGRSVGFLPRHGLGHRILPGEINSRANIYGFKILGARAILSVSAVGSLRQKIKPGDILIPDQFVDRTRRRPDTFFGDGIVGHVSLAEPFCEELRCRFAVACRKIDLPVHDGGTYLCMEGPQFSTRAESILYRSWGLDVIGMTNAQESKLSREAEICYATMAMVTDFDCWHPDHASVKIEDVLRVLNQNTENARLVLEAVVSQPLPDPSCSCRKALDNAVITARDAWPEATFHRIRPLLARFLGEEGE